MKGKTMKLNELTPQEYMCPNNCGCGCPAVFETDDGSYVIIGKKLSAQDEAKLKDRIAADEFVIKVDKAMIDNMG